MLFGQRFEHDLALMPERRVPQVVPGGDRLGELFVETQKLGDGGRDRFHMLHMLHPGADVVVFDVEKHLRFMLQAAIGLGVENAGIVTRKGAADIIGAVV